jgi:hypothetical protein
VTAPRVLLTAGHNRSVACEALAELLRRDGVFVCGILVVSILSPGRLRSLVIQRGSAATFRRMREVFRSTSVPPGQSSHESPLEGFLHRHGIKPRGLRAWCKSHSIPCWVVGDLNGQRSIDIAAAQQADAVIYVGGGILRKPFLQAARRVLNAHAGPLPEVRGMNAAEWAVMLGHRQEVTVHQIDAGIDTGPSIRAFPFDARGCSSIRELRETAIVAGIEGLRAVVRARTLDPAPLATCSSTDLARQCFTMAPALARKLEQRLRRRLNR